MPTAVVSGRVDARVKHRADAVIRNAGKTVGSVINAVWETIAATGELPPSVLDGDKLVEKRAAFESFVAWADSLPEPNPTYAHMTDEEILALKVVDYA